MSIRTELRLNYEIVLFTRDLFNIQTSVPKFEKQDTRIKFGTDSVTYAPNACTTPVLHMEKKHAIVFVW